MLSNELVESIIPMDVLDKPWEIFEPFIYYLETHRERILKRCTPARRNLKPTLIHQDKFSYSKSRIHSNKFDDRVFRYLEKMGLAVRGNHEWYEVEQKTAGELMTFLATVLGAKLNYQPVTDQFRQGFFMHYRKEENLAICQTQRKRELILKELIPYPENIDLKKLGRFKDKHKDLLEKFRNKTEQIALNPSVAVDSAFFRETLRELQFRKEELSARMNESRLGPIFFRNHLWYYRSIYRSGNNRRLGNYYGTSRICKRNSFSFTNRKGRRYFRPVRDEIPGPNR